MFGIAKLNRNETEDELKKKQCNRNGDTEILRDRSLQAILKENDEYKQRVPWYEYDANSKRYKKRNEPSGGIRDTEYYGLFGPYR